MDIRKKIQEAVKGFENLSEEECIEITLSAKSLSLEECYDSLLIVPTDLSAEETKFAEQLHKYGRAIGALTIKAYHIINIMTYKWAIKVLSSIIAKR